MPRLSLIGFLAASLLFPSSGLTAELVGCYKDKADRDLKGEWWENNEMTISKCIERCRSKSFKYAALQYSSHCFCDNDYGSYGTVGNCDMKCSGDKSQICGGSWANSVYRIDGKPSNKIVPVGCFKDKADRDLKGHWSNHGTMTIDKCLDTCAAKGFSYAGLQYASHCFCDNDYGSYGSATNCDMKCAGNQKQICGGSWANSIFKVPAKKGGAKGLIGCFKDTSTRDLTGHWGQDTKMTIEKCQATCKSKGFKYAGLQYASHCFCDNDYGSYGSAKNCDMKCSGNEKQICGGSWANSIYEVSP